MKRAMKAMIAAGVIAVAAFAGSSTRAAPASFAYQGVILEANGQVPATKNRTVEFRIYDGPTSSRVLWGRAYNVLLDAEGLFNAPLSDATGSPIDGVTGTGLASILADNANTALYVGLTVDGSSGEIAPRQSILAVPYAMHAADAAKSSGNFPVSGKVSAAGLEVTGNTTLKAASATSLSVSGGNVTVGTAGSFVGYGTIPKGGIIMWSGSASAVPDGWRLCDGSGGTPDLRGQFVVGYDSRDGDYNQVGKQGGEKKHKLTLQETPSHGHLYAGDDQLYNINGAGYNTASSAVAQPGGYDAHSDFVGAGTVYRTSLAGGDQAHENRPPYYAICFIMRTK